MNLQLTLHQDKPSGDVAVTYARDGVVQTVKTVTGSMALDLLLYGMRGEIHKALWPAHKEKAEKN